LIRCGIENKGKNFPSVSPTKASID
jgi:hypothetical protein